MDWAAALLDAYEHLGAAAVHTSAKTGVITPKVYVLLSQLGGGGIEGVIQGDKPEIRVLASAVGQPKRDDVFALAGVSWQVAENGVPINDGLEYVAAVRRVKAAA